VNNSATKFRRSWAPASPEALDEGISSVSTGISPSGIVIPSSLGSLSESR
jgi:hypothetical protein